MRRVGIVFMSPEELNLYHTGNGPKVPGARIIAYPIDGNRAHAEDWAVVARRSADAFTRREALSV